MQALRDWDYEGFRLVHQGLHHPFLDPVFWVISSTGLGYVQAACILVAGVFALRKSGTPVGLGSLFGFQRAAWWVSPLLVSLALSGIASSLVLKRLIVRDRPSQLEFAVPQEGFFHNSFPSGHATTSFAIAWTLLFLTWKTPNAKWGWVLMAWASLVAFSRVYRGVHWPTDVLGGAALGAVVASLVYVIFASRIPAGDRG